MCTCPLPVLSSSCIPYSQLPWLQGTSFLWPVDDLRNYVHISSLAWQHFICMQMQYMMKVELRIPIWWVFNNCWKEAHGWLGFTGAEKHLSARAYFDFCFTHCKHQRPDWRMLFLCVDLCDWVFFPWRGRQVRSRDSIYLNLTHQRSRMVFHAHLKHSGMVRL